MLNKIVENGYAGKITVLGKKPLLKLIGMKSPALAKILEPVITEQNINELLEDDWVKDKFLRKKRKPKIPKRKAKRINAIESGEGTNMKICIEIDKIEQEKLNELIAVFTSETVADVIGKVLTEENVEMVLADSWIQKKLVKVLNNLTIKKLKDKETGATTGKIKVRDVVSIKQIDVDK